MAESRSSAQIAAPEPGDARTSDGRSGPAELMYANLSATQVRAAKQRARRAVHEAVKAGLLTREPCFRCGTTEGVEGHHSDYNEPLLVIWACGEHHRELHRLMRAPREPEPPKLLKPRVCSCGADVPQPMEGTPGRRPRFCPRCKQTRRALTYLRASERILEQLRDPDWDGGNPR